MDAPKGHAAKGESDAMTALVTQVFQLVSQMGFPPVQLVAEGLTPRLEVTGKAGRAWP